MTVMLIVILFFLYCICVRYWLR